MTVLVDTNLLTRIAEPSHPQNAHAAGAVRALLAIGETLHIVPQNAYEFWVVATRPIAANGLGMNILEAKIKLDDLMKIMPLLRETAEVFPEWQRLVMEYDCKGKPAHDAHLVAAMMIHGIKQILTFNAEDFSRYRQIEILSPEKVMQSAQVSKPRGEEQQPPQP